MKYVTRLSVIAAATALGVTAMATGYPEYLWGVAFIVWLVL